jgi:hypothetical protein
MHQRTVWCSCRQAGPAKRRPHHLQPILRQALHQVGHSHMSLPANFANNALRVIAGRAVAPRVVSGDRNEIILQRGWPIFACSAFRSTGDSTAVLILPPAEHGRGMLRQLLLPLRDLARVHVILQASSARVLSPLSAAMANLASKVAEWVCSGSGRSDSGVLGVAQAQAVLSVLRQPAGGGTAARRPRVPIGPYGGKLRQPAPGLVDGGAGRLDDCRPARQLVTN